MKIMMVRHLTGAVLGAIGIMLLGMSLEQIIDAESSADLWARAGIAAIAAVSIGAGGSLLALLTAAWTHDGKRFRYVWPTLRMSLTPAGVAGSLAISFVIGAILAGFVPKGTEGFVTVSGGLLTIGGYLLTRELWPTLWRAARTLYTAPVQSSQTVPMQSSPASPAGTVPPAQ